MTYNKPLNNKHKSSYRQLIKEMAKMQNENIDLRKELRYITAHLFIIDPEHKVINELEKPFLLAVKETALTLKPKEIKNDESTNEKMHF